MTANTSRRHPNAFRLSVLITVLLLTGVAVALAIWQPEWRDLPGAEGRGLSGDDRAMAVPGGDLEAGRTLLANYGCITCHTIPGVPGGNAHVGPPLTDWGDRVYIAGLLTNTPENLIYWIQNPQTVVPGNAMPDLGVTDSDARDIASYLYSLHE